VLCEAKSKGAKTAPPNSKARKSPPAAVAFPNAEMSFSPLRFSATVANSFPDQVRKEQTLPLLKKCQTHKTPFARWRLPTGVGRTKEGENNLSYQLLKFLPLCSSQTFTVDTSR